MAESWRWDRRHNRRDTARSRVRAVPGPFRNEVVRVADLTVNTNTLEGVEFSNCQIVGPAILVPMGACSFVSCTWPGSVSAIFWEIPAERTHVIGAVAAMDCIFSGCRFVEVGLAGDASFRQLMEENVNGGG